MKAGIRFNSSFQQKHRLITFNSFLLDNFEEHENQ
jgi:hypothetical protein